MPTFDGDNLIVTLDSGQSEVDVFDDLYEPWKDWMLGHPDNRHYPALFRSDGGAPLSSIINQGGYIFLNNTDGWRLKPPEEDITIYLTGNLAVDSTSLPAFVPTDGAYTAAILGLQPITQGVTSVMAEQLEFASYQNAVWLKSDSTLDGTEDISGVGNRKYPLYHVNNAVSIASNVGLDAIGVIGNFAFVSGDILAGFSIKGQNPILTTLTIQSGADVLDCQILNATITDSVLDGNSWINGCNIHNLQYIEGQIEECKLSGNISIDGSDDSFIIDCKSGCVGQGAADLPVVNLGGSGRNLAFRNWSGPVKLENLTGANTVCLDVVSGSTLVLGDNLTAGDIYVRGICEIIGTTSGTTIHTNAAIIPTQVQALFDAAYNRRKWDKGANTVTIYDTDNVTPLHVFDTNADMSELTPQ